MINATLATLADQGWHVRIMTDHNGPKPAWRVWLRWPQGPLPHKEESKRVDTLEDAAAWLAETAGAWEWD